MSGALDLSVVMPAFNEQARIAESIETVREYLARRGCSWEFIVVDDGSTDLTPAIAHRAAALDPNMRVIRSPRNVGKGHAVRTGVVASIGAEVLITDTDLSTPIYELERLSAAREGAVAAIGSRALPGSDIVIHQMRAREILGRMGNFVIQSMGVRGICDTQCGFKLFDGPKARALFAMSKINGWAFDVELLQLCARFGWPVVEVPVRWAHVGGSKLRPSAYLHVLLELMYLRRMHRHAKAPMIRVGAHR